MRILIATPLYPPEVGGPATYSRALEEGLPHEGIETIVVKFSDVRHLPKIVRHLRYMFLIARAGRSADMMLALDPVSVGLPTLIAGVFIRKPFIVKAVGDYAWEQGQQRFGITARLDEFVHTKNIPVRVALLRAVQTFVARRAKQVLVPSEYLKRIVIAWGIPAEKISVIYNAVTLEDTMGTIPDEVERLGEISVVSVGRLVPWKGVFGLIDAVVLARREIPGLTLVVVGSGPNKKELETYAKEKLEEGYVFTSNLSHTDTIALMKRASTFVLNSTYEGFSHVLIEALSSGIPVITTSVGGNVEIIKDERNGLLVNVGAPLELAQAITRILQDPALSKRLRIQGRADVEKFSIRTMLKETSTYLQTHA
jgi:glycosyltransferase involved in cell wall biosynthesis